MGIIKRLVMAGGVIFWCGILVLGAAWLMAWVEDINEKHINHRSGV